MSYIPILLLEPNISEGYLILKIIYLVTKYLIKHLVVYFLSSVSTLKHSSDIYFIRHILTKIIGTLFYCGTNFLNTLYVLFRTERSVILSFCGMKMHNILKYSQTKCTLSGELSCLATGPILKICKQVLCRAFGNAELRVLVRTFFPWDAWFSLGESPAYACFFSRHALKIQ